ncbi:citrate:proton symporter, partial [Streptomyces cinereoruber]
PMIPALGVGLLFVFALAYVLGRRERKRIGYLTLDEALVPETDTVLVAAGGSGGGSGGRGAGGHAEAGA